MNSPSVVSARLPEAVGAALPFVGLPPPGDDPGLPDHVPRALRQQVLHAQLDRVGAVCRHTLR